MQVESGGNLRALSPKGAIGLMQIMPLTWEALRQRYRLGADPYDAHDNILAGTALLRELYDRFGAGGFLAAYNAGPVSLSGISGPRQAAQSRDPALPHQARGTAARTADWRRNFRIRRVARLAQRIALCSSLAGTQDCRFARFGARQSCLLRFCRRRQRPTSIRTRVHRTSPRTPPLCSLRSALPCRHDVCRAASIVVWRMFG